MITKRQLKNLKLYCYDDISDIENYEQAMNDETQVWDCHHRAEILPCGNLSRDTLKKFGLYYHRPASELIFLTKSEHMRLHAKGKHPSEESRMKMSKSRLGNKNTLGRKLTEEHRRKISDSNRGDRNPNFGKKHTEEAIRRMREARKAYWERKRMEQPKE